MSNNETCVWCDGPVDVSDCECVGGGDYMHTGCYDEYCDECDEYGNDVLAEDAWESDGQPDEYTEWQDVYGGDDWDHGQYDDYPESW